MRFSLAGLVATLHVAALVAAPTSSKSAAPRFTQHDMFNAMDLSRPELARVKQAFDSGDIAAAQRAFVAHLRSRTTPVYFVKGRDPSQPASRPAGLKTHAADLAVRNIVTTVSVRHDYGREIDWFLNPTRNGYKEYVWQLSRHSFWNDLQWAYATTGDERYAKSFVGQLNSWIDHCPRPDDSGNYANSAWRTIEAGIRMGGSWQNAFFGFLRSPSFDDASICRMVACMVEHALHLMKYPTRANWLTMESNGLFCVGTLFPEFKEAAVWRQTALERLRRELDAQVYPDGAQMELSTGYHQVALRNFVQPVQLARLNAIALPAGYVESLERMYHYNLYAAMPSLQLPDLNDGGHTDIRRYCAEGFEFFPHRKDFLWAATARKEGLPPSQQSYAFPYAGHLITRSGWGPDDAYLLFDAGPFGLGHQHEDKLSFVLYAHRDELIIDPGNYPYDSSPWRRYHTGSYAHNVVHVDGQPQNRRRLGDAVKTVKHPLPFEWKSDAMADYASASYDDGFGPSGEKIAAHRREILFVKPDYWLVIDTLRPHDEKPHEYEALFHTAAKPDEAAMDPKSGLFHTRFKAGNIVIAPVAGLGVAGRIVAGQEQPTVQGWVKCGAYEVRPAATAVYGRKASNVVTMAYVFYPFKGKTVPVASAESVALKCEGCEAQEALGVRIRRTDGTDHIVIRLDRRGSHAAWSGGECHDRIAVWTRSTPNSPARPADIVVAH